MENFEGEGGLYQEMDMCCVRILSSKQGLFILYNRCGKEQDESIPKFAKQGHEFCSPKCMRSFKYD